MTFLCFIYYVILKGERSRGDIMSNITDSDVMKHLIVNLDDDGVYTLFSKAFEILIAKDAPIIKVLTDAGCIVNDDGEMLINYEKLAEFFENNTGENGQPILYVRDEDLINMPCASSAIN